ncbi:hypothetical protein [Rubrivirga sp.]|uniref:hypothetical protein n=1 Tax=Rubrivirga sp. TaxID=1885344 RepID=UPI003C7856F8
MTRTLALAAVCLLAGCDETGPSLLDPAEVNVLDLSQSAAELVGTWDLTTWTTLGPKGRPVTEPVTGYQESYAFRADGTVTVTENGEPMETTFDVRPPERTDGTRGEVEVLFIGGRTETFGVRDDQLFFDRRPADGALNEYRRRPGPPAPPPPSTADVRSPSTL